MNDTVEKIARCLAKVVDGHEHHWEDYTPEATAIYTEVIEPLEVERGEVGCSALASDGRCEH